MKKVLINLQIHLGVKVKRRWNDVRTSKKKSNWVWKRFEWNKIKAKYKLKS